MYYNDHAPAHFHAKYGEYRAKFAVDTGEVLEGSLPRRALALVEEWRSQHVQDLETVWQQIARRAPHTKIEPLE